MKFRALILLSISPLWAQTITTSHYVVTNSASFPLVPISPQSLVFVNGAYKNKGTDYKTPSGNKLQFSSGVLANGNTVDVVNFSALVTDEIPEYQAGNTWKLAHLPLPGTLECWRNGAYQTRSQEPGHPEYTPDYSISGAVISSAFWTQLSADGSVDVHRCRYEY